MSASSTPSSGLVRMNAPVFYFAATFILLFGITVIAIPQQAGAWLLAAQNWAANTVGWYYMLAMTLYLVFVVVTALSGYGKIKLGADHDVALVVARHTREEVEEAPVAEAGALSAVICIKLRCSAAAACAAEVFLVSTEWTASK